MANRTKTTPTKKASFLAALRRTAGNVTAAAKTTGVGRVAWYAARAKDPDFAADWDEVVEEGTEDLEQEAYRRACRGTRKPTYQGGKMVGYVREYSDTLMIFLLKARRPEKYRDRKSIEHSGPGGGPIKTDAVVDVRPAEVVAEYEKAIANAAARKEAAAGAAGDGPDGGE